MNDVSFTYFLFILGCQFNYYDAEKLAIALDSIGGNEVVDVKDASVAIIFACSVRQKAADRILGHIRNWKEINPKLKVIVTACVLPPDRKRLLRSTDLIVDEKELINDPQKYLSKLSFRPRRRNPLFRVTLSPVSTRQVGRGGRFSGVRKAVSGANNEPQRLSNYQLTDYGKTAYVTITAGCNNFCSYCAVPLVRGRETSKPLPLIVSEINDLSTRGYKSIMLLGQNVNSYGLSDYSPRDMRKNKSPLGKKWSKDNPSPFVKLLREIAKIDGLKKISFLSPNPQDMSDDLIDWMKAEKKFARDLNLPVQSGSNRILKRMNRRYSRAEYLTLVKKIRSAVPGIYLSTDIIVGFPGETKKDFEDTVDVVKKCKFNKAFISIYSPRPGTASAMIDNDVSYTEKKRRWDKLNKMINL